MTRPPIEQWRKPRTSYRYLGPITKPERLQIRRNYGKDSALEWSGDLRNLPAINFIQLYDYPVGTHYDKLKSCKFFFEENVKKLEGKIFENKTYVMENVLHSMKKTPNRAVLEFSPMCDVLRAECTYSAVLGLRVKGKCNHIGGVLLPIEDFIRRFQNNPKPLTSTPRLSV